MFVNVFVKDTWSFCHINQYLLLFIHFAQTAVFNAIQQTCIFIYLYKYIYICVYILDVICFVMVLVLCVVDPLPLRLGACCITRIQHREPKSMFLFLFYSHAVYSLSLDPFGFWLFTAIHAWKRNALYSPSQSQSLARHWNECLVEAKKNKTLKK